MSPRHAHGREGAAAAVRAGVRSIEHGTWVDDATLAEMKRRGTFFVPTLAVMSPLGDPHGNSAEDVALQLRTQSMMGPLRAAVRKARALGITIAAATDGSYADNDDTGRIRIAHEIAMLRDDIGMTPLESITAATLSGARVLGVDGRTGSISVGMEATSSLTMATRSATARRFSSRALSLATARSPSKGPRCRERPWTTKVMGPLSTEKSG
jgi:imidazolonepropionase-like amidohydrolase